MAHDTSAWSVQMVAVNDAPATELESVGNNRQPRLEPFPATIVIAGNEAGEANFASVEFVKK